MNESDESESGLDLLERISKGRTMAGNDLGSLLGGLLGGGNSGSGGAGNILGSLLSALGGGGQAAGGGAAGGQGGGSPLDGIMDMLKKSGLAEQAESWVGTGENKAVSGEQVAQALPDEALAQVAQETGVTPQEAADQVAQALPQAVDKLTPEGSMPQATSLEDLIRQQGL
ncbi:YidB family protein [Streptomyces sp. NPDC051561]|uniref:YidB family protein n=1 Tax=Streptomyces sp. NPDC051561 TaxID=3365658 RepID=UPI003797A905